MSLRSKILLLFGILAIAPILTIGVADYMQSIYALEQLVRAKIEAATETSAGELGQRYALAEAELRVMAEHELVQRHLETSAEARATGGPGSGPVLVGSRGALEGYVLGRQSDLRRFFSTIEILDPAGQLVFAATLGDGGEAVTRCPDAVTLSTLSQVVLDATGAVAGRVVGVPLYDGLLPLEMLEPRFGAGGYNLVVDRRTGTILYSHRCEFVGRLATSVLGVGAWEEVYPVAGSMRGQVRVDAGNEARLAAFVALSRPPWTVMTTASLEEFTVPFGRLRIAWLALVLFVAAGAAGAFIILTHGYMRSLKDLTGAADRIGQGEFDQWLPPPGRDEAGRLSLAFATMVARLRRMMREVELGRQLAVVGKMSSYLAHEIRNPLSSIRLNLQGLAREAKSGEPVPDLPEVVELCLNEVNRLETVVQSVLKLGSTKPGARSSTSLHRLIGEALELLRPELGRRRVVVETALEAPRDIAHVDAEQIKGVLLNLFLNAADAMPRGGRFRVRTALVTDAAGGGSVAVHVSDEGTGVPPDLRDDIFQPFFTTKKKGSGIGLSISRVTAEQYGGRVYLNDSPVAGGRGAEFVLELPLAAVGEPAVGATASAAPAPVAATG